MNQTGHHARFFKDVSFLAEDAVPIGRLVGQSVGSVGRRVGESAGLWVGWLVGGWLVGCVGVFWFG